jgi:hypothetical protein
MALESAGALHAVKLQVRAELSGNLRDRLAGTVELVALEVLAIEPVQYLRL